jgi:hypothetical protein
VKHQFTNLSNQKPSDDELLILLENLIGYKYTFSNASHMRWGVKGKIHEANDNNPEGFYQIMPENEDGGFFNWYCEERLDYQFFKSTNRAVLHFIFYWTLWRKMKSSQI